MLSYLAACWCWPPSFSKRDAKMAIVTGALVANGTYHSIFQGAVDAGANQLNTGITDPRVVAAVVDGTLEGDFTLFFANIFEATAGATYESPTPNAALTAAAAEVVLDFTSANAGTLGGWMEYLATATR